MAIVRIVSENVTLSAQDDVAAFLAGHAMAIAKYRGRLHTICFAIVMTAAVYVIIDFEFPRFGLIRIDSFDQLLVEVRDGMK